MTITELHAYAHDTVNLHDSFVTETAAISQRQLDSAYTDGYSDGREYGRDGFMVVTEWSESQRSRYIAGFKRGVKVHNARFSD